jgi:hypothetical protein
MGRTWWGAAPFHEDHTPSLVVTPDKNLWHCLGACNTGGSVIDWVMRTRGVSFRHAVGLLRADHPSLSASGGQVVRKDTTTKLDAPVSVPAGDREIIETLYSTGMRRLELVRLTLWDLDLERATAMIRQGKGKKDRIIPLGDRAAAWVRKYLDKSRPRLAAEPDDKVVFLSNAGEPLSLNYLTEMVRGYVDAADIGKRGACHLFRHTMATLMLEGGTDIRFIQAMLGHADLKTTQIYTHVAIRQLQEIHRATHPAKLKRERHELAETLEAEEDKDV